MAIGVGEEKGLPAIGKLEQKLMQEPASAFVQVENSFEVEHVIIGGFDGFENIPHDQFAGGEGEVALELISLNRGSEFPQRLGFLRSAHPAGVELCGREFQPDHRAAGIETVKQVQIEAARKF